jgi:hypothetical protein
MHYHHFLDAKTPKINASVPNDRDPCGCYTVGSIVYHQTATLFLFIDFQQSVLRPKIIFFATKRPQQQ